MYPQVNHHLPCVLAVDDNEINLEIITEYLEETNYEIMYARDGYQAWSMLENYADKIDVVLLDRMLPKIDGMEILKKMRDHPAFNNTPVIFQTAKIATNDVLEGMLAGAFYYLSKPYRQTALLSAIKSALNRRSYYEELQERLKKTTKTLASMQYGVFKFKTPDDAYDLALFISSACPNPEQTLSGLSELMINAIEHGNLGITYAEKTNLIERSQWEEEIEHRLTQPQYMDNIATLDFQLKNNQICISIKDMGDGFEWADYLEISLSRLNHTHGRGIAIAKILSFDKLEYHGNGNEVRVTINRPRVPPVQRKPLKLEVV